VIFYMPLTERTSGRYDRDPIPRDSRAKAALRRLLAGYRSHRPQYKAAEDAIEWINLESAKQLADSEGRMTPSLLRDYDRMASRIRARSEDPEYATARQLFTLSVLPLYMVQESSGLPSSEAQAFQVAITSAMQAQADFREITRGTGRKKNPKKKKKGN
jgi:hypothetical protein